MTEKPMRDILARIFPNFKKDNPKIYRAKIILSKINRKEITPRHVILGF